MSVAAAQPLPGPLATTFARIPDHVVYRPFPHETVVLNLQTGKYHGLNPTAGRMLELLERGLSIGQSAGVVADEYQRPVGDVEHDLQALCTDLSARGLIELSTHGNR
jgi:hypothetical protein